MSTFDSLPGELISKIATIIVLDRKSDGYALRLVSKTLNGWVTPVLFSTVILRFEVEGANTAVPPDFLRCRDIITALASHSTRIFEHAKRLRFSSQNLFRADRQQKGSVTVIANAVLENIFTAISSLKNLESVDWFYNPNFDPEELAVDFIRALSTISSFHSFEDLRFGGVPPPSFTFQPLSGLRILKCWLCWQGLGCLVSEVASLLTRCPNLYYFHLYGDSSSHLADLFGQVDDSGQMLPLRTLSLFKVSITTDDIRNNIQHFQSLENLTICRNSEPHAATTAGEICTTLLRHNVFLKRLKTDIVDDPLLDYLASYSGIRDLELSVAYHPLDSSPVSVDRFYEQILPHHRKTLEKLELGSSFPSAWTKLPSESHLGEIVKCQRLRMLKVYIELSRDELERDDTTTCDTWLAVGVQLPELTHMWIMPSLDLSLIESVESVHELLHSALAKFRRENGGRFSVNSD